MRVPAATLWAVMLLAGCGNISHIGTNTDGTPVAAVATVAQPFTIDAGGVLQTKVRAGAEVVLTGTNSQKANGNGGTPILTYAWQQISTGSTPIDLIPRTTDSVSFTAPDVAVETPLTIRLTVTDASGNTSSATGVVTVEPILDSDHFLEYLLVDDQIGRAHV